VIDLGLSKMALIGAVALIVIGPEKLPRVARTVGTLLGKAQRYVADVKAEVNRSMELDELKKMKETVENAARDVEQTIQTSAADFDKQWSENTADSGSDGAVTPWSRRRRNTGIPKRSGGSSRAPRPSGTRHATACAPGRCPGPRAWRVTVRRRPTSRLRPRQACRSGFPYSPCPIPRNPSKTNLPAPSSPLWRIWWSCATG